MVIDDCEEGIGVEENTSSTPQADENKTPLVCRSSATCLIGSRAGERQSIMLYTRGPS